MCSVVANVAEALLGSMSVVLGGSLVTHLPDAAVNRA